MPDDSYDTASRIVALASITCFFEIIKGGEIRKQFGANKNQSVNTPFSIQVSIILLL